MKNQIPRLVALMRENAQRPRNYRIENATGDEATIYIYDVIGMDFWTGEGVTAANFAQDLDGITAPKVNLRINSPGGDVFEARAIVAAMTRHPATFVAYVDGVAASAASVIAVNADQVEMAPGSFMMIHKAWTIAVGNYDDMTATANLLNQVDTSIANDYVAKSGATLDQVMDWMKAETWFDADQAVANGFADAVTGEAVKNCSKWNLSAYANAPKQPEPPAASNEPIDDSELRAANERRFALIERIA